MPEPLYLLVDCSEYYYSICLFSPSGWMDKIVATEKNTASLALASSISEILQRNQQKPEQLSAIGLCEGPGSYTGLRIAASTVKGLSYALDIPIISFTTFQLMIQSFKENYSSNYMGNIYIPMIDARRMEVYLQQFNNQFKEITSPAPIILDENYFNTYTSEQLVCFGSGALKCNIFKQKNALEIIENFNYDVSYARELFLQKISKNDFLDPAYFHPLYLK